MQTKRIIVVKKNQKFGLIDANAKVLLECIYDNIWYWHELDYSIFEREGKLIFIDAEGKPVSVDECEKPFFLNSFNDRCGIFQKGVITPIDPVFDFLTPYSEGVVRALTPKWKVSLIDTRGKVVGSAKLYDGIDMLVDGFAFVRRDGLQGLLNVKGEEVVPIEYDDLKHPTSAGYVTVFKNQKAGLVTTQNQIIFEPVYDRIVTVNEHTFALGKDGKTKIVDLLKDTECITDLTLVSKL